ncbi:MAG: hypothetical protein U9Q70_10165, partial [Chloroflexota bacterium]|nr:hypothetical protein [Chloroflexota bacterium]
MNMNEKYGWKKKTFGGAVVLLILLQISLSLPINVRADTPDVIITGVIDGPLTEGTPKAIELYVVNDIADLSSYGIGSANNGGGSDDEEFTFPVESVSAGEFLYVAYESTQFTNW